MPTNEIETLVQDYRNRSDENGDNGEVLCRVIELMVRGVLGSYEVACENAERMADRVDKTVGLNPTKSDNLKKMHLIMRRVSLQRRALLRNVAVVENSFEDFTSLRREKWTRIVQEGKRTLYVMEEVEQSIASDMNLELSLAHLKIAEESQQTNEVMRTLTLFSVIFMPLTLIAGIYGMNFKFLPELEWNYGYFYSLGLMVVISLLLTWWFVRKGYLTKRRQRESSDTNFPSARESADSQ